MGDMTSLPTRDFVTQGSVETLQCVGSAFWLTCTEEGGSI